MPFTDSTERSRLPQVSKLTTTRSGCTRCFLDPFTGFGMWFVRGLARLTSRSCIWLLTGPPKPTRKSIGKSPGCGFCLHHLDRGSRIDVSKGGDGTHHINLNDYGTISIGEVGHIFPEKRDSSMLTFPCFEVRAQFAPGMRRRPRHRRRWCRLRPGLRRHESF
jgi:hypothetical protein